MTKPAMTQDGRILAVMVIAFVYVAIASAQVVVSVRAVVRELVMLTLSVRRCADALAALEQKQRRNV